MMPAQRFVSRPVTIEAFQMTEARRNDNTDWPEWLNQAWNREPGEGAVFIDSADPARQLLCVGTIHGVARISWGDWIARTHRGDLYPITAELFEEKYAAFDERLDHPTDEARKRWVLAKFKDLEKHLLDFLEVLDEAIEATGPWPPRDATEAPARSWVVPEDTGGEKMGPYALAAYNQVMDLSAFLSDECAGIVTEPAWQTEGVADLAKKTIRELKRRLAVALAAGQPPMRYEWQDHSPNALSLLRGPLAWFVCQMERKLSEHDATKGHRGWIEDDLNALAARIQDELDELTALLIDRGPPTTAEEAGRMVDEAADIANMAMMVADIIRSRSVLQTGTPPPDSKSGTEVSP